MTGLFSPFFSNLSIRATEQQHMPNLVANKSSQIIYLRLASVSLGDSGTSKTFILEWRLLSSRSTSFLFCWLIDLSRKVMVPWRATICSNLAFSFTNTLSTSKTWHWQCQPAAFWGQISPWEWRFDHRLLTWTFLRLFDSIRLDVPAQWQLAHNKTFIHNTTKCPWAWHTKNGSIATFETCKRHTNLCK